MWYTDRINYSGLALALAGIQCNLKRIENCYPQGGVLKKNWATEELKINNNNNNNNDYIDCLILAISGRSVHVR